MKPPQAIIVHPSDNVATAIAAVAAGAELSLAKDGGTAVQVRVTQDIPTGHKFSLFDIAAGAKVVKYGQTIGLATTRIAAGTHVHNQNVESRRGRGDLAKKKGGRK